MIYVALFGVLIGGAVLMLFAGLMAGRRARLNEEGWITSGRSIPTLEEVELSLPFFERAIRPTLSRLLTWLGKMTPQRNAREMQHKLEIAGRPYGWTPADLMGLRVLCGMVCLVLALPLLGLSKATLPVRLLLAVVFGLLGYYLPLLWLSSRTNRRKRMLIRALPDGLDMLNVCVGAGLGFDAALSRVGERWQSPLADEFNRVVTETRLGKTRRQALLDFAGRTEVTEIETFVAALVQADQLGVSIAKVLHAQAEQMRIFRRQRAEELARQAAIKMLFPLVFLIFPSLLAVLLGPAVPQILRTFTDLGK